MPVTIKKFGVISAIGQNADQCAAALFNVRLPKLKNWKLASGRDVPVIAVQTGLKDIPVHLAGYDCRNNRLAHMAYLQIASEAALAVQKYGVDNVGVVVGSSTSGLDAAEDAFSHYQKNGIHPDAYRFEKQHAMGSLAQFIADLSGAKGPAYTISTACSSAAKAMLSAKGLLETGICKAVITGGVDTLCNLTVNGFASLGQVSGQRMNPLSGNRSGLNIGEGGALFLLTNDDSPIDEDVRLELSGGGETLDAYHISAPHPEGLGAKMAMEAALKDAEITADNITYVNLHGTATRANDAMETKAVAAVCPGALCSSSKPFTGHCLGASGAVEAAFCCISLSDRERRLIPHVYDGNYDFELSRLKIVQEKAVYPEQSSSDDAVYFLSNSFAFGGSNCSIVLGAKRGQG